MALRVALLLSGLLGCGCAPSSQGPQAPPLVEARKVAEIPRDAVALPNEGRSIKFAIIGDSGRGSVEQHEIAAQMVAYRQRFDYRYRHTTACVCKNTDLIRSDRISSAEGSRRL